MNPTATMHGMDGTLMEPDWPPLTLPEVREVLEEYPDCGEALEILSASPRPFSAASLVETERGSVFVKRHHRLVRDREGLSEEHRFIAHLRAHGAPVAKLLENSTKATALEIGEWTYEVHETTPGVDLYEKAISWTPFQSAKHACSAGRALARLHSAAVGFGAPARRVQPLVASFSIFAARDPARAMEEYLRVRPALATERTIVAASSCALDLLAPFHTELQPLLPELEPLWTHNDLHASNLFWSEASLDADAVAVIDFGLADRTNAVHDLAHAIERNIVGWLALIEGPARQANVPVHFDHLRALLDGYESLHPMSREEAVALAPMLALCHAEFALTEADYFLGVLRSQEKARFAVPDYLVRHAQWFRSADGMQLLDWIRRWADEPRHGGRRQ
jgi:Ser/Thr protein kinase RdoA (MazF antagonist)